MQYMILATETADDFAKRDDPAEAETYWAAWSSYVDAINASGLLVGSGGLMPPRAATTLRIVDGQTVVEDGPYADTKEQLGGYFVIEVDGLDTAMEWAQRCPSLGTAAVEVRPLLPPPGG